jgi:hypothetical protein
MHDALIEFTPLSLAFMLGLASSFVLLSLWLGSREVRRFWTAYRARHEDGEE